MTLEKLIGNWKSTNAFGNTSLDWTELIKKKEANLYLSFSLSNEYTFILQKITNERNDPVHLNSTIKHGLPMRGKFTIESPNKLIIQDTFDLEWFYFIEDNDVLRLRLVGAKKFARCKGVDIIYFNRIIE